VRCSSAEDEGGVIVAPAVRDLPGLAHILEPWLGERMPEAENLRVADLEYPRGAGQSHETILFDAVWEGAGATRSRGLAVRIKPTGFTVFQDDMFEEQFLLMRHLHQGGYVRVADTLWYESDPALLGAPFFVMEKLSGRVPVSIPSYMASGWVVEASVAQRSRLWENGVRELAKVQAVPLSTLGFLADERFTEGFDQEWDRWTRFLAYVSARHPLPEHLEVWRELRRTMPDNRPPGLVWGDARIGNMMVDEDFEIVALMDWEQPSLGGALQDLGWWLFNYRMKVVERGGTPLPGIGDRRRTVEIWQDATGLVAEDIDWYEAFAGFKMACLAVNMADLRGTRPVTSPERRTSPHLDQVARMLHLSLVP
jgi:aminoglycoside phosphotransferase (APT) family kinase protein